MTQELGRIDRPSAEPYRGKRTLMLVPLVYPPPQDATEGLQILERLWDQMQTQVASLEASLGSLRHIYHESLFEGGEDGLKHLESTDQRTHGFVQGKCQLGATLEPTESEEFLKETLDLQRCLMMPLTSDKVAQRLQEWFGESNRARYEHIAAQIDTTLGEGETGLLFINERHQVQFPADVQVFYVAPPALDEFRRWLQNWMAAEQQRMTAPEDDTGE